MEGPVAAAAENSLKINRRDGGNANQDDVRFEKKPSSPAYNCSPSVVRGSDPVKM